jgi:HD-like signal output (HDOD) protein
MPNSQPNGQASSGFDFVKTLAAELSRGKIDLPSFPEVAIRVGQLLNDRNAAINQIVRVVGSDPALAARLLLVSNAASFNRSGKHISDLRTAITRIGHTMLRTASMAFAMSQLRRAAKLDSLRSRLAGLWQRSTEVAALCYVLARTCSKVNPDEAMLAGMMHGVGKLYILSRAAQHPELFGDNVVLDEILDKWHASIGQGILENWEFAESMSSAVGEQDDLGSADEREPDLRDIIAVAIVMAAYPRDATGAELALNGAWAAMRLGLDQQRILEIMQGCALEVAALGEALGS